MEFNGKILIVFLFGVLIMAFGVFKLVTHTFSPVGLPGNVADYSATPTAGAAPAPAGVVAVGGIPAGAGAGVRLDCVTIEGQGAYLQIQREGQVNTYLIDVQGFRFLCSVHVPVSGN